MLRFLFLFLFLFTFLLDAPNKRGVALELGGYSWVLLVTADDGLVDLFEQEEFLDSLDGDEELREVSDEERDHLERQLHQLEDRNHEESSRQV